MIDDRFKIIQTQIPEVVAFQPNIRVDDRGAFWEAFDLEVFAQVLGLDDIKILKVNNSYSRYGVLRGMHYQRKNPQGKILWVTNGAGHDAVVDCREGSPTVGQFASYHLSRDNKTALYVPPGFAHGFLALKSDTVLNYLVTTNEYDPADEQGIHWNDPGIKIDWPIYQLSSGAPEMNKRDAEWPSFKEASLRGLLPSYQSHHPAQ